MVSTRKKMEYGLKWNPDPPVTVPQLVAYALATGVYTILAWLSILALPFIQVPGVGGLFIAMGFGVPFAMWFGGWGLLMGFIGTSVGTGILTGMPVPIAAAFGVGDIILFGSLVLIYRGLAPKFGVDPLGRDIYKSFKSFLFFFICGANIPHILGSAYGTWLLYATGLVPPNLLWVTFFGMWIGNVIVVTVIAPILLRFLGPVVERFGLTNHGWLT